MENSSSNPKSGRATSFAAPSWTDAALGLGFAILAGTALYFSLRTPFRLIDDYFDWRFVRQLGSRAGFADWFSRSFLTLQPGRYRPVYDFYHFTTWTLFGPNPAPHHLVRWLWKGTAAGFFLATLRLFTPPGDWRRLPAWLFLFFFWFFPNNPESRLAPQELHTIFFLAPLNYLLARLVVFHGGDLARFSWKEWAGFGIGFLGVALSKETNLGLEAVLLGFPALAQLHIGRPRNLWRLAPFGLVFLHTVLKVKFSFQSGGYGISPITTLMLYVNFKWLAWALLSWPAQGRLLGLLSAALIFYAAYRLTRRPGAFARGLGPFYFLLLSEYAAMFAILTTSWAQVVRYFFPLVFLQAALAALAWVALFTLEAESLEPRPVRRRLLAAGVPLACLYFAGLNCYPYLYQFVTEYHDGLAEKTVLDELAARLRPEDRLLVRGDNEFGQNMGYYFNELRPLYFGQARPIETGDPEARARQGAYFIGREGPESRLAAEGWKLLATYRREPRYRAMQVAAAISALFRLQRPAGLYTWVDGGTQGMKYPDWYLWRRAPGESRN